MSILAGLLRILRPAQTRRMHVIERVVLGPGHALCLVRVDDREVLIVVGK